MKRKFIQRPIFASEKPLKYVLITSRMADDAGTLKRALRVVDKASIALQEAGRCTEYEANKTEGEDCVNGIYKPALHKLASEVSWIGREIDKGLTRKKLGQMFEEDVQGFYHPYVDLYDVQLITKRQYDDLELDEDGWVIEPEYELDEDGWDGDYE